MRVCATVLSAVLAIVVIPPLQAAAEEAAETPRIEDFAFMAGHWRGQGLGGEAEEIWSEPMAGTMMGAFRLTKEGAVELYELMLIGPDAEGWSLKVKHFSDAFVAWEEKEDAVRFAFEKVEGNRADFDGLKVARDGEKLVISVRMRSKDGTLSWEDLHYRRHPLPE